LSNREVKLEHKIINTDDTTNLCLLLLHFQLQRRKRDDILSSVDANGSAEATGIYDVPVIEPRKHGRFQKK
jgi:hypothetical protein